MSCAAIVKCMDARKPTQENAIQSKARWHGSLICCHFLYALLHVGIALTITETVSLQALSREADFLKSQYMKNGDECTFSINVEFKFK